MRLLSAIFVGAVIMYPELVVQVPKPNDPHTVSQRRDTMYEPKYEPKYEPNYEHEPNYEPNYEPKYTPEPKYKPNYEPTYETPVGASARTPEVNIHTQPEANQEHRKKEPKKTSELPEHTFKEQHTHATKKHEQKAKPKQKEKEEPKQEKKEEVLAGAPTGVKQSTQKQEEIIPLRLEEWKATQPKKSEYYYCGDYLKYLKKLYDIADDIRSPRFLRNISRLLHSDRHRKNKEFYQDIMTSVTQCLHIIENP